MTLKNILKASAAFSALTLFTSGPGLASTVDLPSFEVEPLVIVWAANESDGSGPVATDFIVGDGNGGYEDLIGSAQIDGRTLHFQSLQPTADSFGGPGLGNIVDLRDSSSLLRQIDTDNPNTFDAFDVDDVTVDANQLMQFRSAFFVASNTAFRISANKQNEFSSGDYTTADLGFALQINQAGTHGGLQYGSHAQNPVLNGGSIPAISSVDALIGQDVFIGGQKTAISAGTIAEQSVRFFLRYNLANDVHQDLSNGAGEVGAEIIYTVYVP